MPILIFSPVQIIISHPLYTYISFLQVIRIVIDLPKYVQAYPWFTSVNDLLDFEEAQLLLLAKKIHQKKDRKLISISVQPLAGS